MAAGLKCVTEMYLSPMCKQLSRQIKELLKHTAGIFQALVVNLSTATFRVALCVPKTLKGRQLTSKA